MSFNLEEYLHNKKPKLYEDIKKTSNKRYYKKKSTL